MLNLEIVNLIIGYPEFHGYRAEFARIFCVKPQTIQNVDPFPNHYKIFIHALAFIAHIYQYGTFPLQDAIIEHICQSIDSYKYYRY